MATAKSSSRKPSRSGSGGRGSRGILKFFLGFLFAFVVLIAGGFVYLKYGHPPVATADPAFPFEAAIVHVPLSARIEREIQTPPFEISEDAYEAGAHIYKQQCAACHGSPGEDTGYAKWMYPSAPQLWKKHRTGTVVGVSDDPTGETYWKVKNGIRLTGMPAFQHILTTDEMWDVSLLLKNADQQLPDPVMAILKGK
jgi:mono/diheme cytochrome c family protein